MLRVEAHPISFRNDRVDHLNRTGKQTAKNIHVRRKGHFLCSVETVITAFGSSLSSFFCSAAAASAAAETTATAAAAALAATTADATTAATATVTATTAAATSAADRNAGFLRKPRFVRLPDEQCSSLS